MIDQAFQLRPRPHDARRRRLAGLLALALLPSLSGCIAAAVAVPLISAVSIAAKGVRVRAATPVPEMPNRADGPASPVRLTSLTELPAPGRPGGGGDPWQPFVAYALRRATGPELTQSVLLSESGSSSLSQRLRDCPEREPAVIVDLDAGPAAFSPGMAGSPAPGLAEGLARLREAGVIVLWISQIDANQVREVADALVVSGLDPTGRDPLLLARNAEDRKQTLREEANLDVCVIAIAGDRRSDFDELFDFLRDPNGARALEGMFGSGWFIAPVPFGQPPAP